MTGCRLQGSTAGVVVQLQTSTRAGRRRLLARAGRRPDIMQVSLANTRWRILPPNWLEGERSTPASEEVLPARAG